MTFDQMREALGLGPEVSDAQVTQLYGEFNAGGGANSVSIPPVTLPALKKQLRLVETDTDDDDLLTDLLMAAVDHVERETGLVLSRREVTEGLDRFGDRLRSWPIVSIDAVGYVDGTGIDRVLPVGSWRASVVRRPARLTTSTWWPATVCSPGCITVTMTAGYADVESVPGTVIRALNLLVAEFYANREPGAISADAQRALGWLLRPHKVKSL